MDKCNSCDGSGIIDCSDSYGTLAEECGKCNGTGKVFNKKKRIMDLEKRVSELERNIELIIETNNLYSGK